MSVSALISVRNGAQQVWLIFFLQLVLSVQTLYIDNGVHNDKVIFEHPVTSGERIVQDITSLHSGVQLDFSYNETIANSAQVSAPGCPKSLDGTPWLYYGSPPRCYLVGFQGPCSFGKRFFSVDNSKYGLCNCDCFASPPPVESSSGPTATAVVDIQLNSILLSKKSEGSKVKGEKGDPSGRYNFCQSPSLKRQVVYDGLRQECYPVLEQGPCIKGEWLIRDLEKENGITCEKRKCPEFGGYSKTEVGGGFTYFDYRSQTCLAEVYGSLQESFFASPKGIVSSRQSFCRDGGMKYSTRLKTCVKDVSSTFNFNVLG